jgi:glucose-6-phosphate isomerase
VVLGVDVLTRGDVLESALEARDYLVTCGVPAALAAKDPRLWGRRAVDHSRLGWLDLPIGSQELLGRLDGLMTEIRHSGLDHIVLVGVGAESLAAQSMASTAPTGLTVLDGADSSALSIALTKLDRTLVVLSSKQGVSIEGDAYRRIFEQAFRDHGLPEREIAGRFLVITDHGSPLDDFARDCGYRLGLTDPYLPGHFGALSAYGVVPAALAGADVATLLDQAAAVLPSLTRSEDNPGLLLGSILGGSAHHDRTGMAKDKLVLRETGGASPLSGWITQLVATATGKQGRGILPFDPAGRPPKGAYEDVHGVALNPQSSANGDSETSLWAPLGAQFVIWEYATAVAGWLMGVNPFETSADMVREVEADAARILHEAADGPLPSGEPSFVDDGIAVYAGLSPEGPYGTKDLAGVIGTLTRGIPPTGYLSIVTYLSGDFSGRYLAPGLARRIQRPVTYGPGPGYLHGTGTYHKQGPGNGVFLVVTGSALMDRPVPGRPYTLGKLQQARALADVRALRRQGLPVVWLHLRDPIEGAGRLAQAVREAH